VGRLSRTRPSFRNASDGLHRFHTLYTGCNLCRPTESYVHVGFARGEGDFAAGESEFTAPRMLPRVTPSAEDAPRSAAATAAVWTGPPPVAYPIGRRPAGSPRYGADLAHQLVQRIC
jgi:hypothetical protein